MSTLAARSSLPRLSTLLQGWRRSIISRQTRALSVSPSPSSIETTQAVENVETVETVKPEVGVAEEAQARPGWLNKGMAAAFLIYMGVNAYPMIAEGTIRHSVLLLSAKDSFFRRSGASRLVYFAATDERRKRVVEAGGVHGLVNMLRSASDDRTRCAALKAMASLCQCGAAVDVLEELGGRALLQKVAESTTDSEMSSLITTIQRKMNKSTVEEASVFPLGASVLAM